MRDYGSVSPRFWTGETGKALRGHPEAQLVALYLQTAPGSHMIGLYYLALPTLAHETGLTIEGALKGLARASEVGFCHYDREEEVVWVPEMARFQIGEKLRGNDKRILGVENELENFKRSRFFNEFLDRYAAAFDLKIARNPEPLLSPLEGASKPHRSQEQEQEQDQDQDKKIQPAPLAAAASAGANSIREAEDSKATPEQQACRRAIAEAFAKAYLERSGGERYSWTVADRAAVKTWANKYSNDPQRALAALTEFIRRMASDEFLAKNFNPAFIGAPKQLNALALPVANAAAPPRRGAFVPLTNTAERFAGVNDGDPLGLNLKPKTEASRG